MIHAVVHDTKIYNKESKHRFTEVLDLVLDFKKQIVRNFRNETVMCSDRKSENPTQQNNAGELRKILHNVQQHNDSISY